MLLLDDEDELSAMPEEQEQVLASELGVLGLKRIDAAILTNTDVKWLKVARVIMDAIKAEKFNYSDAIVALYSRRVIELVASRALDSQGNLRKPRFSEIRRFQN